MTVVLDTPSCTRDLTLPPPPPAPVLPTLVCDVGRPQEHEDFLLSKNSNGWWIQLVDVPRATARVGELDFGLADGQFSVVADHTDGATPCLDTFSCCWCCLTPTRQRPPMLTRAPTPMNTEMQCGWSLSARAFRPGLRLRRWAWRGRRREAVCLGWRLARCRACCPR